MTAVIADTSPINYLLLIDEITIPPRLYGEALIPPEVLTDPMPMLQPKSHGGHSPSSLAADTAGPNRA